jgi:hypothetical protein
LIHGPADNVCVLAIDSRRNYNTLGEAWVSLLDSLAQVGIGHEFFNVDTRTNNPGDAKLARVFPLLQ